MAKAVRWILGAGLLISLLGFLTTPWWFELFGHARFSYLILGACLLPLVRERVAALLWTSCLLLNLACVLPCYFGGSRGAAQGKLLLCNVFSQNPTPERVRDFLQKEQADVVALLEVHPSQLQVWAPLLAQYPGQKLLPRTDHYGMALLSKQELTGVQVLESESPPTIVADTMVAGHKLHVIAAHPLPPFSGNYTRIRNQTVAGLAEHLQDCPRPFGLMGDLNNTPWSPTLAPIRDQALTARAGFGVLATWPSIFPGFLRIAIDHCFLSPEVKVVGCRVGPMVGSDHLPLVVEVSW